MGANDWGYCSKNCPKEKENFCYADTGTSLKQLKKCVFLFILNGVTYHRCVEHLGSMQCATKLDADGVASASDMYPCVNTKECGEDQTVNGNPVVVGFVDVASYTNAGSSCMSIEFQYSTGYEDTTSYNWNVEASVSAEFNFLGAEFGVGLTASSGGATAGSASSEVSHTLSYQVSPFTRVTLRQLVAKAGNIEAHSHKIQLAEVSLHTQDELIETIPGEKMGNGTAVPATIPCPKIDEGDDGDDDDDDAGGDGGDAGGEEECSNEKYGDTEEETSEEKNAPPKKDIFGNNMPKRKKRNEHCSTKSQEEADEEKKAKEEQEKQNASTVNEEEEDNKNEDEEEEESTTTTTTTTTTTRRTTTKKPRRRQ